MDTCPYPLARDIN